MNIGLPKVVWSLRTQKSRATGCSPFFLVYGLEAVLPANLLFKSPRVETYCEDVVDLTRQMEVNLLEERQIAAKMRQAHHEHQIRRYHDKHVRKCSLNVGDMALRRIQNPKQAHKLTSPWEGPFIVREVIQPGTYCLQWANSDPVPNVWNIEHLIKFYP